MAIETRGPTFAKLATRLVASAAVMSQAAVMGSPLVLTTLSGQDKILGAAGQSKTYDYPNPRIKSRFVNDYVLSLNLNLLGQDKIFGAPGQSKTYDYPNPRIKARAVNDFVLPLNVNLLGKDIVSGRNSQETIRRVTQFRIESFQNFLPSQIIDNPKNQFDWSNPLKSRTSLQHFVLPFNVNLLGKDFIPGQNSQEIIRRTNLFKTEDFQNFLPSQIVDNPVIPGSWPNPIIVKGFRAPQVYRVATIAPQPLPLNQFDWPNPRIKGRILTLDTIQYPLPLTLPLPERPVVQTDWPNPQRLKPLAVTNLNHTFYYVFESIYFPAKQTEWPNPLIKPYPIELRTAINRGLIIEEPPPFNYDYPNPRRKEFPLDLRTFIAVPFVNVQPIPPFPSVQYDWPNPIIKLRSREYIVTDNVFNINLYPVVIPVVGFEIILVHGRLARQLSGIIYEWL